MVTAYTFKNQPVVQEDWVEPDQPAVLDASITAIDAVIHLRSGTGSVLPSPTAGRVATAIIDKEIIAFIDNTADVLTGVTRGFGGTQQAAHGAGRQVRNVIPAEFLNLAVLSDDPRLADARPPVTHGVSHYSGGTDALALLDLAGNLTQARSHDSADTDDPFGIHHTIGSGAGNVVAGDDARLNDARTPAAHATTHDSGGSDTLAVDSAVDAGSLRTLGVGALQAAPGDHGLEAHPNVILTGIDNNHLLRFDWGSNAWVNTAFSYYVGYGLAAARPPAGLNGRIYVALDTGAVWMSTGGGWSEIATDKRRILLDDINDVWTHANTPTPGQVLRYTDFGGGDVEWGNVRLDHADLVAASIGTNTHAQIDTHIVDTTIHHTLGTGAANAAAGNDARFTDARTPTVHAATHNAGGTDALAIDAVAATGSLRTLGVGAQQAAAGTHGHTSLATGLALAGVLTLPDGLLTAPSLAFTSEVTTGFYKGNTGEMRAVVQANEMLRLVVNSGVITADVNYIGWGSTGVVSPDVKLFRDGAGLLAQRNGVNAQRFRIYNTYTDVNNYEAGSFAWTT